jgi:hypothetical protein
MVLFVVAATVAVGGVFAVGSVVATSCRPPHAAARTIKTRVAIGRNLVIMDLPVF